MKNVKKLFGYSSCCRRFVPDTGEILMVNPMTLREIVEESDWSFSGPHDDEAEIKVTESQLVRYDEDPFKELREVYAEDQRRAAAKFEALEAEYKALASTIEPKTTELLESALRVYVVPLQQKCQELEAALSVAQGRLTAYEERIITSLEEQEELIQSALASQARINDRRYDAIREHTRSSGGPFGFIKPKELPPRAGAKRERR